MTDKEIEEIAYKLLEFLKDNSLTIDQLSTTHILSGEDCVELNKGRKTSLSAIKAFLKSSESQCIDVLTSDDERIPSEINVFSAVRSLLEIANNNEFLKSILLRKDQNDRTKHKLAVEGGLQIGRDFIPGILDGIGAFIDKEGRGELESLILRRFLEVPEMRYSRTKVVIGDKWRAPGGGLIESVDTETQTVTLKIQEKEIGAVAVGDICMGIFHSVTPEDNATEDTDDSFGNRTYAGFFTAYFTITEVIGADKKQFKYQLRPESERWKHSFHPTEAMSFVSYGNFTDEDRQTSVYETRTYTRMLRKQNTWEIGIVNIAFQYGEMGNMSVHGVDMSGYSMYLSNIYVTGSINQINPDGSHSKTANDRGEWKTGTVAAYYDRFSWNNALWLCVNEDGTDSEPTDGNTSWLKQIESGTGIAPMGHWESANTPYRKGSLVSLGNAQYLAKRNTSRPPIALLKAGESYLTTNYGYIPLGTFSECGNPEDWERLVQDGTPGQQGIPGCIVRKAEWASGIEWRNDEGLEGSTRYLDIALVRNNSLQTGWQAYKCLRTHISTAGNAPGNTQYWEPFGLNVNAIFTSLIIAKDAHLDFVQGNRINIKKDDGTVTAGMSGSQSGDKTRIWAGGADPDNAPFRVGEGGHATIYDADISGQFSAAGGKIILYRDGSGRLASGKIYWDADGNIYICGIYQTKTSGQRIEINPSTNSFRMYNENNQLVMSMVFEDMAGMGVSMPKIRMYDYNASNQLLKSATYSSSGMSIVDYINATGRTLGVTLSPSIGLSFDENGLETKRYARK